ncbi:MAG: C25 family cysteine peptidase [Pirellulaceae bacterium]|nr:C25 family cysteine peptidase [Pirellulaceae bacterium]
MEKGTQPFLALGVSLGLLLSGLFVSPMKAHELVGHNAANGDVTENSVTEKSRDNKASTEAAVLLITSKELAESWQPFAHWKTLVGKATKIVTVEEIEKGYEGKDIQQKIKACVADHTKNHKTKWVILGGDSQPGAAGHVPDRDTPHQSLGYKDIPTDIYYISEKSWDANNDGVYGEFSKDKDEISYTGPATIGRIPVRTPQQVKDFTQKVISYESKYPTDKFATDFVYVSTFPSADYKSDMLWEKYLSPSWPEGKIYRFMTGSTPWDKEKKGDYDLTPTNWVERINKNTGGKMHLHGHGLLHLWQAEGRESITAKTIDGLNNENAYLVMTTVSCFTGEYDSKRDPCIVESLLRAPNAGAVVVCAPSRPGVPIFHGRGDPRDGKTQDGTTRTYTRFWINGLTQGITTGEAFALAKKDLTEDAFKNAGYHWCQCELNLLGDPTLDMRPSKVTDLSVVADVNKQNGKYVVTAEVESGGADLTICVWNEGGDYFVGSPDASGKFEYVLQNPAVGKVHVTVSGPSRNTVSSVHELN